MRKMRYATLALDVLMLALAAAGGVGRALAGDWWHALTHAVLVCWVVVARIRAVYGNRVEDERDAATRRATAHAARLAAISKAADRELRGES